MKKRYIILGILVAGITYLLWPIEVQFSEDEAVVVFKRFEGGTQDAVVTRSPFKTFRWNKSYVYDLNPKPIEGTVDVLNRSGKKCSVDYQATWSLDPDKLASLHEKMGPDYKESVVRPVIAQMIREQSAEVETPDYSFEPEDFREHYLNVMDVSVLSADCT